MHARRLEQVEVLDREPPVLRAAGENDRAGAHALTVGQAQHDAAVAVLGLEAVTSAGIEVSTPNFCACV